MHCRRCQSDRLIPLEKKNQNDNDVFRCQECRYLFSPSSGDQIASGRGLESRAAAVESGYQARR